MKKVTITLPKLTSKNLIFIQIVYNCFVKWAIAQFSLPYSLNYVTDIIAILLLVQVIFYAINGYMKNDNITPTKFIIAFFIYTVLDWLMHMYSPIYYLWGLRNNFRFYVFLIACSVFLEEEDIHKIFKILYFVFIANILMCTYQYFILHKKGDYLAGFFGSTQSQGGNGPMLVLCTLVCIISVVQYMEKRGAVVKSLLAIIGTLYIAVIAELKALYLVVVLVVVLSNLVTRFTLKKFALTAVFALIIPIAVNMLYTLYPQFEEFFSYESIMEYVDDSEHGYSNDDDLNRLSAISYCMENFLETPTERLFGIGMGNADGSTNVAEVTSEFYKENFRTHYTWFSVPFMFIETGFVGLFMYFWIFVLSFKSATRLRQKKNVDRVLVVTSQVVAIFAFFIAFLNAALRVEITGYLYYFMLSIPYIISRKSKNNN